MVVRAWCCTWANRNLNAGRVTMPCKCSCVTHKYAMYDSRNNFGAIAKTMAPAYVRNTCQEGANHARCIASLQQETRPNAKRYQVPNSPCQAEVNSSAVALTEPRKLYHLGATPYNYRLAVNECGKSHCSAQRTCLSQIGAQTDHHRVSTVQLRAYNEIQRAEFRLASHQSLWQLLTRSALGRDSWLPAARYKTERILVTTM